MALNPSGKIAAIEADGFSLLERKFNNPFYPNELENQAHVNKWLDFIAIHLDNGIAKALFNKVFASMFN